MFTFEINKLVHAIIYFAIHTNQIRLGKTKLMKLLYFSDFRHMKEYDRPIIGDTYSKYQGGPVPNSSYKIITAAEKINFNLEEDAPDIIELVTKLKNAIEIGKTKIGFNGYSDQITFTPKIVFDPKVFSKSDLKTLEAVAKEFYNDTGAEISNKSHKEKGWKSVGFYENIDYKFALDSEEEVKQFEEY